MRQWEKFLEHVREQHHKAYQRFAKKPYSRELSIEEVGLELRSFMTEKERPYEWVKEETEEEKRRKGMLDEAMTKVNDIEMKVLKYRLFEGLTQMQAGRKMQLSDQTIRHIERKGLAKMRDYLVKMKFNE